MEMNISIILMAIFLPACVMAFLSMIQQSNIKASKTTSDEQFVVMISKIVISIGLVLDFLCVMIVIGFTLFSEKIPHIIFYIIFGLGIWLGTYLALKTLKFKVIVKGEEITVQNIFGKPFTFTFSEIVSAVRQVKKNQVKSERIVVKTTSGKKLIVESSEISYKRFLLRIKSEVKSECLFGFE